MHICYKSKNFGEATSARIEQAADIIAEYTADGLDLTLRQLYYQFVSRAWLPNRHNEYKKLGVTLSEARLAGLLPWDAIVDRTRYVREINTWRSPESIVRAAIDSYKIDRWKTQPNRVEVWIEKEALIGAISKVCHTNFIPHFACKGNPSQSSMWLASQRFIEMMDDGQQPILIYLGDHDPTGMDITRDIQDRLDTFTQQHTLAMSVDVRRIALNMDQIREYNPPPNAAKMSDTRAPKYVAKYGYSSWELDALEPRVLQELIKDEIDDCRNKQLWKRAIAKESRERKKLKTLLQHM